MLSKLEPHQSLLLRAAVIMAEQGFCQYKMHLQDGSVCLEGALRYAYEGKGLPWEDPIYLEAQKALQIHLGTSNHRIWNDETGRTKEEAVAALEAAAYAMVT